MGDTASGELRVVDGELADPARLRALLANDGYLYFRGVLGQAEVRTVHQRIVRILVEQGMAAPADPEPTWSGPAPTQFAQREERRLQGLFGEHRLWQRLVAVPSIAAFFTRIIGRPPAFIPLARYRVAPPGGATDPHRDATLNPGFDMTTVWIPLMRIDTGLGGLALVPGSHRDGSSGSDTASRWCQADCYEPGDLVLMHEALLHAGRVNRSPHGIRLSLDVRFQNPTAAPAVVGRIDALAADWIRIRCDDGQTVTLEIDEGTLLRGKDGQTIPRAQAPTSDLEAGLPVIAARCEATAVMVRPL